ncbi:putative rhodanese-related sulfurtransferase [Saccharicrinis fermentans DSM 9555 = JCM 21142]|uniref:tRNA uridine(34) hydroxylase n=1 Tax=Saccharicrinis fermentans DSM 9555 = JCM 21142 TaxID=869213 RepID=W7Y534_9BACT|nr:rhodanese-related sulfurtransferase [Saccharicrinis fermentans]GAF03207.1 putative rhodanese-related sulfurtransferase [Saccharicrinis fermentans DSM 9555 = JCM 21142]
MQEKLDKETFKRKTVSFYRYVIVESPFELRNKLFAAWNELDCLGRIYVAKEGINAQMNVPEHYWEKFVDCIQNNEYLKDIPLKIAVEDDGKSFLKLQVKVRNKIVADGLNDDEFDVTNVGKHLDAREWNRAMDQGALVVDMRNHYESEVGKFEGAITPQAEKFADELPEVLEILKGKEEEKVLLYCTGGVRCEKTSAFLKHHGFKDVNQLYGGIIDYKRQVDQIQEENRFKGVNFVFDNRLGERISNDVISHCHQCGKPCDTHVNCSNVRCNLLFIQCEECASSYEGTCSDACKEYVMASPERKQELDNIHQYRPVKRYFKSRC